MKQKHESIRTMVALALLTALVVVLQTVASGIRIGMIPISLTLVPIVIGAILFGPKAGGYLGGVFGVITLVAGITGADSFTFTLWTASPLWTAVTCLGKGIGCGVVSGLVYRALQKSKTAACFVAAMSAPIVNTGLFALAMMTVLRESLIGFAGGADLLYVLFIGMIGINFLVEFAVNAVLSAAISRIVQIVAKSLGKRS